MKVYVVMYSRPGSRTAILDIYTDERAAMDRVRDSERASGGEWSYWIDDWETKP